MPILTQPAPPSSRRRPWLWVLLGVLGVVFLLFAWSWLAPVRLEANGFHLLFGRLMDQSFVPPTSFVAHDYRRGQIVINPLPRVLKTRTEFSDMYLVEWRW